MNALDFAIEMLRYHIFPVFERPDEEMQKACDLFAHISPHLPLFIRLAYWDAQNVIRLNASRKRPAIMVAQPWKKGVVEEILDEARRRYGGQKTPLPRRLPSEIRSLAEAVRMEAAGAIVRSPPPTHVMYAPVSLAELLEDPDLDPNTRRILESHESRCRAACPTRAVENA